jgi:C4-dicarboxylate transporter, DctM subunit
VVGVLFISLLIFFIISVPVAISLGFSSILALLNEGISLMTLPQAVFQSLDAFTIMAVPFFILAGNLMQIGGISRRLINLANAIVGWLKGGLGSVAVLTSMFFATMSGSSAATTAAVGSILIPAMEKKGYPKNFAAAVCATSGELGAIIPPSIALIMYGLATNTSIGDLFLGGIIPGIFIGISLIITITIVARIKGFDTVQTISFGEWFRQLGKAFSQAILPLMMPVVIIGGIYSGLFTPTESAVIAVVFGFVLGFVVYREYTFKDLLNTFAKSAVSSGIILLIVGFASIFAYILTINQVPQNVSHLISQATDNPIIFLLIVNLLLFITGMFMESLAAIIILAPILAPIAMKFGIDPVHFGIIMVVNLAIGMCTPPVGVNLFVACQVANLRLDQIIRPLLIFLGVLVIDVLIISFIPGMSLSLLGR